MLLSVIIPVHNGEEYLERCVKSILNLHISEYELIMVENGSTDKSWEICCAYANKFSFVYAYQSGDIGVSNARNTGVAKASGDYITFVDCDDWILDNCWSDIVDILKTSEYDIVSYGVVSNLEVNKACNKLHQTPELLNSETYLTSLLRPDGIRGYSWNKFYNALIFQSIMFDPQKTILEDLYFNVNLSSVLPHLRALRIYEKGYVYAVRPNSRIHSLVLDSEYESGLIQLEQSLNSRDSKYVLVERLAYYIKVCEDAKKTHNKKVFETYKKKYADEFHWFKVAGTICSYPIGARIKIILAGLNMKLMVNLLRVFSIIRGGSDDDS